MSGIVSTQDTRASLDEVPETLNRPPMIVIDYRNAARVM